MVEKGKNAHCENGWRLEEQDAHRNGCDGSKREEKAKTVRDDQEAGREVSRHYHVREISTASFSSKETHSALGWPHGAYLKADPGIHQNSIFMAHGGTDANLCAGVESAGACLVCDESERYGEHPCGDSG